MHIDILGRSVAIVSVDSFEDEDQVGCFSLRDGEISVLGGMDVEMTAKTIVHEAAHAVFQMTGDIDRTLSEEDFAVLSELFLDIFKKRE
jgi:hypothetical protein